MKKPALLAGILLLSSLAIVNAQGEEKKEPASTNPTVTAITSKYHLNEMPETLSVDKVFPVIGTFESTSGEQLLLTVSLDPVNKAFVWISGLPQGKVKAILYKSPATYKIMKQKTEEGNDVPEGTLIYDKEQNILNICIGKKFDGNNPASAFVQEENNEKVISTEKIKISKTAPAKETSEKPWLYTGTKQAVTTAKNNPM